MGSTTDDGLRLLREEIAGLKLAASTAALAATAVLPTATTAKGSFALTIARANAVVYLDLHTSRGAKLFKSGLEPLQIAPLQFDLALIFEPSSRSFGFKDPSGLPVNFTRTTTAHHVGTLRRTPDHLVVAHVVEDQPPKEPPPRRLHSMLKSSLRKVLSCFQQWLQPWIRCANTAIKNLADRLAPRIKVHSMRHWGYPHSLTAAAAAATGTALKALPPGGTLAIGNPGFPLPAPGFALLPALVNVVAFLELNSNYGNQLDFVWNKSKHRVTMPLSKSSHVGILRSAPGAHVFYCFVETEPPPPEPPPNIFACPVITDDEANHLGLLSASAPIDSGGGVTPSTYPGRCQSAD
jgi:hypothetical protein